jgi:RNA polymerase sigma factor (sigma-70 family)
MTDTLIFIEGCKQGDRKAQEMLFRECYDFAMRIAARYSRDGQDAADIISHAFIKVFKSIDSYDVNKGSFNGWVHRIIINEGLDHIKSRNKLTVVEMNDYTDECPAYNEALAKMDAGHIMEHVRQLPPATHAVFMLYVVDGYPHKEIAKKLSISEGTSKWHLSEARKILQKNLSL